MLFASIALGLPNTTIAKSTGFIFFDIFKLVGDLFSSNMMHGGLMIITVGGYALYMKKIKASEALVDVALQPMSLFNKFPYIAVCCLIPLGQILFICIPSATGLSLLLATSVLPLLLRIGVTRLTAVSAITATTVFDLGPGSSNALEAAELAGVSKLGYFIDYQLAFVAPMTLILMVAYYFSSRYFDKRDAQKSTVTTDDEQDTHPKASTPHIYAILPVLPLILLLAFSNYTGLFTNTINLDITTATLISLFAAMTFELIRYRDFGKVFYSLKTFWNGMGHCFTGVITLIICAEIYSKGLISLGLVEALLKLTVHIGLPGDAICVIMTMLVFLVAMLMGSANAAFFSFGPLGADIANRIGVQSVSMILPMQISAGIGRTLSPIASVVIAISEVGGVAVFDVIRRNLIPVGAALLFMLVYNHFFMM